MTFTESNTVEQMILDNVAPKRHGEPLNIREDLAPGYKFMDNMDRQSRNWAARRGSSLATSRSTFGLRC
jgi:hypothetical protein